MGEGAVGGGVICEEVVLFEEVGEGDSTDAAACVP
jgi:hypothetical protein